MKSALSPFTNKHFTYLIITLLFFCCRKEDIHTVTGNSKVNVYENIQYGSNIDVNRKTVALKLDVYVPANATANQTYPFIFFVHGGGFTEGTKTSATSFMENFANSGYVAVAIDYRVNTEDSSACNADTNLTKISSYMAAQDTRAALRFMVANAAKYHVDTSKIFLSGNSAGAITILNTYYFTQKNFDDMIPNVKLELGGLYDADNDLTNTYTIKAIAANSGALSNVSDIKSGKAIPTIFFHGELDPYVPIDSGYAHNCTNSQYLYGSRSLYNEMLVLGIPAVIHVDPTGGHLSYNENFLAENETCFFKSVLNAAPETGYYTAGQTSCQ